MADNPANTIAFDFGSSLLRCGAITETHPTITTPTIVGHRAAKAKNKLLLKRAATADEDDGPRQFVGDAAIAMLRAGEAIKAASCIEHGTVVRWDDFELLLSKVFEDLGTPSNELSTVIAVPAFNPVACTERVVQTMFESFDLQRVATVPQGLCALYASGRTTGIVLDSGHGVTSVTPVFDSYPIELGMNRMNVGGAEVTDHLQRLLYERGYSYTTPLDLLNLRSIKEELALVVPHYQAALAMDDGEFAKGYELPDGSNVMLAKERFRCTEILFQPNLIHSEHDGLADFVAAAIKKCPLDSRRAISSGCVLSGGNTMIEGFAGRFQDELAALFPGMFGSVHVIDAPDRVSNVWSGAAVLANMDTFEPHFVTRDVYDEHGPSIIHN